MLVQSGTARVLANLFDSLHGILVASVEWLDAVQSRAVRYCMRYTVLQYSVMCRDTVWCNISYVTVMVKCGVQ